MDICLQPADDGFRMRTFGPWVVEKLDYLERYIYVFEASMHNKPWRRRCYIDLFAGCGKCRIRNTQKVVLGSPLIALTTQHPFTDYFFVDESQKNIDLLKQRCSASPHYERIHFMQGDANLLVHEIVEDILTKDNEFRPGRWPSLNLAFLDPDGLQLQWQTVATLAQVRTMDLIIHYPQMGLNRYMANAFMEDKETAVDPFFGGQEWGEIYRSGPRGGLHRELMNLYKSKLEGLGYKEVLRGDEIGDEPLVRNAERRAPLYRLLFASKHPLGHKFWQQVVQRDFRGQRRMAFHTES